MKKSLVITEGDCPEQRETILNTYTGFKETPICKIFPNHYFGYTKVTIEQPMMENGVVITDKNKNPKLDGSLRDFERILWEWILMNIITGK